MTWEKATWKYQSKIARSGQPKVGRRSYQPLDMGDSVKSPTLKSDVIQIWYLSL